MTTTRKHVATWTLACVGCFAAAGHATSETCDPRYAASPQFVAATCRFRNMDNPQALPSQSSWKIWSRFLTQPKEGTVPVDPIPVRRLDRAQLDALPTDANHIIRLGHSSHLLKLRGNYWLIDPVFGERASPFSFAGPKRFHPTPLKLEELPPIDGMILSHDPYDHRDLPTIRSRVISASSTRLRLDHKRSSLMIRTLTTDPARQQPGRVKNKGHLRRDVDKCGK